VSATEDSRHQEFIDLLPLIERVIAFVLRRHCASAEEIEDFASEARLKLFASDRAILRKFQGRSSMQTYLTIVVSRLFLDYRNAAWGRWRNSEEARRSGEVAMLLERLLARDGYTFDQAFEILRTNHRLDITRRDAEALVARFPARTRRQWVDEETLDEAAAPDPSPEEALERAEQANVGRLRSAALAQVMTTLDPQDQLILTLHYRDGRKLSEIASLLRLEQKPLYRRIERILKQLRRALQEQGLAGAHGLELES
jgi:RNA polymerase sigma factor (sigma-70 family)